MACREVVGAALIALVLAAAPAGAQQEPQAPAAAAPAEALKDGILNQLERAIAGLRENRRTTAVVALDEAHRLLGIAAHLEEGAGLYGATELRVKKVRHLTQNGRPDQGARRLAEAAQAFLDAPALELGSTDVARYSGATLLNVRGKVLGELALTPGGEPLAMIGDWRDTLGVFDLDGAPLALQADMLIAGPRRTLGRTYVIIATPEDQQALLERAAEN